MGTTISAIFAYSALKEQFTSTVPALQPAASKTKYCPMVNVFAIRLLLRLAAFASNAKIQPLPIISQTLANLASLTV